MTTLETIVAELQRQHEECKSHGLGWFDSTDTKSALIDGYVDLEALAAAIDGRPCNVIDVRTTDVEIRGINFMMIEMPIDGWGG